ncbi:MAG: tetratricopeptide repeat protein [Lentisphaeria bacterium]|nr:tetratricopeptide repeat protein [Lentisphaeria bacterium]
MNKGILAVVVVFAVLICGVVISVKMNNTSDSPVELPVANPVKEQAAPEAVVKSPKGEQEPIKKGAPVEAEEIPIVVKEGMPVKYYREQSKLLMKYKKYDEARAHLSMALTLEKDSQRRQLISLNYAGILLAQKDMAAAYEIFDSIVDRSEQVTELKVKTCIEHNDFNKARRYLSGKNLTEAFIIKNTPVLLAALQKQRQTAPFINKLETEKTLSESDTLLLADYYFNVVRNYKKALPHYESLYKTFEKKESKILCALKLAVVYQSSNPDSDVSITILEDAIFYEQNLAKRCNYKLSLARLAALNKQPDLSETSCNYIMKKGSGRITIEAATVLIKILTDFKRLEAVVNGYLSDKTATEKNPAALLILAEYSLQKDDAEKAISYYKQLRKIKGHLVYTRRIAQLYEANGNHIKAAEALQETIKAGSDKYILYGKLHALYKAGGDKKSAIAWAERQKELTPNNPIALERMARTHLKLKNYEEAAKGFYEAAKYSKHASQKYNVLYKSAKAYNDAGNKKEALRILNEIIDDPASVKFNGIAKQLLKKLTK